MWSCLIRPLNSLEYENIGKFYQIENELSNKLSADTLLDIRAELSKLENRISAISAIQSACDSITPTGNFEQTHHAILNLLLVEEMHNLTNLDSMYTLLDASSNIDSLLLTLNTDSLSRFKWTNSEQDSIQVLAKRCAFTYGKSVFNARAMWSSFDTLATPLIACEIPNPVSARYAGVEQVLENETVKSIHIYPNPANSIFTIELPEGRNSAIFNMYDIYGRFILSMNLTQSIQQINPGNLSAGVYLYEVLNVDGSIMGKDRLIISQE